MVVEHLNNGFRAICQSQDKSGGSSRAKMKDYQARIAQMNC